jgi:hypothetical protein
MKSWTKPTAELVNKALASTADSEQRRYFFYKLENPLWIKPLWDKGFFRNPPKPIPVGDGGLQIPIWPESQYLARMAKLLPKDVVEIAAKIHTDNSNVLEDITDIALVIDSPELSKKLFPQVVSFLENKFAHWRSSQKVGKLIIHWAQGGAVTEALELIEKIIWINADPKKEEKEAERKEDPTAFFTHLEPYSPFGVHVYKKFLTEDVQQLVAILPWEMIKILIRTLEEAIRLSYFEPDKPIPYDASDFWCQHLKDEDIYEHNVKTFLGHALTNACELLLKKTPESMGELDKILRSQRWYFFARLRWYLCAQFPSISKNIIREGAIGYDGYSNGVYGFEFASMLQTGSKLNFFTDDELREIFQKIEQGPDIERYKERFGNNVSDEQVQNRKEHFFVSQLFPFAFVLPKFPDIFNRYKAYVLKYGEPQLSNYVKFRSGPAKFVPDVSPITAEELKAKSNEEILNFLNNWKPLSKREDFSEPNAPGLAKAFTNVLKEQPDRFLQLADRMTISNPTCLRDFLYFLVERAKQKQSLPWEKVVCLCEWTVTQQSRQSDSDKEDWRSGEPDYTTCRQSVASLLQHGSYDYSDSISWNLRSRVFSVIRKLCTEFDNRLESNFYGTDFLTEAINSVRGEAAHALIDHALWIKRHLGLQNHAIEGMPEIQLLVEERLNPVNELSFAIHSVFGLLVPALCYLDKDWFISIKNLIFPAETNSHERWFAAWKTFVTWNHPNGPVFSILINEYKIAISGLNQLREDEESRASSIEALGRHLITFYWWGLFPLSGEHSLLEQYIQKASFKERAHVMNYVGQVLGNSKELPQEIGARLMEYWQARFNTIKREQKPEEFSEELFGFVWWFKSGKLETSWCLKQLKALLEYAPEVHETYFLLEDLARVAPAYPIETVVCVQLLVNKISRDRYVFLDSKYVKVILNAALVSNFDEAKTIAESTQDTLLRLGRFEYKDLTPVMDQS